MIQAADIAAGTRITAGLSGDPCATLPDVEILTSPTCTDGLLDDPTPLGVIEDPINEINAAAGSDVVESVSRFVRSLDGLQGYTGFSGTNFPTMPGEAYFVTVTEDVTLVPAHY